MFALHLQITGFCWARVEKLEVKAVKGLTTQRKSGVFYLTVCKGCVGIFSHLASALMGGHGNNSN